MLIGYMRPYQGDLECKDQASQLRESGCDHWVIEEHASPKQRIKLEELLQLLQSNDVLIVTKLFALADSTRHLAELLHNFNERQINFISLYESIDTRLEEGQYFYKNIHSLLHFQTDIISENTKKGMYEAKQRGSKVGRPRKLDDNIKKAIQMYESKKYSLLQIREETGISKTTLYRYLEN
ncbi:recombinase family protein [Paenibacillus dauci]|uniref:recombinase family protein n=1 Tax=Paenibacillus dauci TaxID=1567106 RepID=UPI0006198C57|nr:recombinase family protein [Paenibacillus dauci]